MNPVAAPRTSGIEVPECLHCGSRKHVSILEAPDIVIPELTQYVVTCSDCGFAFTSPRPTPEAIGYCYPDTYLSYDIDGHWDTRWRASLRRRLTRDVLKVFYGYPRLTPPTVCERLRAFAARAWIRRSIYRSNWIRYRGTGRMLDFGCGNGAFLRTMRDFGWQVEGMDFSEHTARAVQSRFSIPVHLGSLPHPAVKPGSFDVVTMWHSLEHVHNPRETIRHARKLLSVGGELIIAVPNFGGWAAKLFGKDWFCMQLPRHLSHFTPFTLRRMLEAEGFTVTSTVTAAMDDWVRQSARLYSKSARTLALVGASQECSVLERFLKKALRSKPLAAFATFVGELFEQGDNLIVRAEVRT